MNSRERVFKALKKINGMPDRVPVQFDLCRQLTESFGRKLKIEPDYALSYYEDLTYRISANEIRTRMGSDVVVVGGTVPAGYSPEIVQGNITKNEFGMHIIRDIGFKGSTCTKELAMFRFPEPRAFIRGVFFSKFFG